MAGNKKTDSYGYSIKEAWEFPSNTLCPGMRGACESVCVDVGPGLFSYFTVDKVGQFVLHGL